MRFKQGLSLISMLMIVTSTGFALEPIASNRQTPLLFSKLSENIRSSGVATFSLGPVWESAGDTQTFYLAPETEKTYAANHASHSLTDGEIFLGIQKPLRAQLEGQIGLALAMTDNAALTGNIWDDADPQFNNYSYNYNVRHTHIALKGKLLANIGYLVTPWVSGSVGVGFNQAHDFSNTPTISEAIVMPNFTSNTTSTLTYTLGVGIERTINPHLQVGIGYEFADWGKSQLGRAAGQTMSTGLSLSHLYTNGFLCNLTYLS